MFGISLQTLGVHKPHTDGACEAMAAANRSTNMVTSSLDIHAEGDHNHDRRPLPRNSTRHMLETRKETHRHKKAAELEKIEEGDHAEHDEGGLEKGKYLGYTSLILAAIYVFYIFEVIADNLAI